MRTLAVINEKGGCGKTTTTVNVAAALAEKGQRVLVIDLDPQAAASSWLGVRDGGRGLCEVFAEEEDLINLVRPANVPNVDIVPSSRWLGGVEKQLAQEAGAEAVFRNALRRLPPLWDVILLDCPPTLGIISISALNASDRAIVPVEASAMVVRALPNVLKTIDRIRDRLNPDLEIGAVLACRVESTRHARDVVEVLRKRFQGQVLNATIRKTVRVQEAAVHCRPLVAYDSVCGGAQDYRAVAEELLSRLHQDRHSSRGQVELHHEALRKRLAMPALVPVDAVSARPYAAVR